jgi:hypothetical protein
MLDSIPLTNLTIKFSMKPYYQEPMVISDGAIKQNDARCPHKSYTVDIPIIVINSSNCNNPDRGKLNTQQPPTSIYNTL